MSLSPAQRCILYAMQAGARLVPAEGPEGRTLLLLWPDAEREWVRPQSVASLQRQGYLTSDLALTKSGAVA